MPMFKNPVLEYFSHIHPITPVVVFVPVIVFAIVQGILLTTVLLTIGIFLLGVLLWTAVEYVIHRFAFHIEPKTVTGKRLHFLVHGVHHDYPRDSTRLVMPLLVSVPLAAAFFFLFQFIVSPHHWALFAGFVAGYVAYDSIHYATHHWPMTNKVGRFLKEYHMKHHYVESSTAYGVSNPLWDYVFNTVPAWARKRRRTTSTSNG